LKQAAAVLAAAGLVAAIFAAAAVYRFRFAGGEEGGMPTYTVRRGPLRISVTEAGTIQSREQIIIKSEVEGEATILFLIEEGTNVKEGDLLVELDASKLVDAKIDQQIQVENAEAAFIGARENLAVVENQAQSDIDLAELTLEFARIDLNKYLEGEYQNARKEAQSTITLAREELQTAQEKLKWSRILFEEKYLSQAELQIDELAVSKRKLDVELAENSLRLLEDFTHPRTMAELESNVRQAEMALERVTRKAKADVVQAEATLRAKQSEYQRQKDKLAKIEEQIGKARIYAPADGLVIYATSAQSRGWRFSQEPLDEGQKVREMQELIYLPTASAVKADVKIHEASLEKVAEGLPVIVTVDALPGRKFPGQLAKIAPLPDAQFVWLNPDLKVYNAEVYLEGDGSDLRTGMSCMAEIIITEYDDVTYVPVQAVLRVGGKPAVYVKSIDGFQPRTVDTGLDNNRLIHIKDGLRQGEEVLLTPPLEAAAVGDATAKPAAAATVQEPAAGQSGPEPPQRPAPEAKPPGGTGREDTQPQERPGGALRGRPTGERGARGGRGRPSNER
jgi:HlyD family secretion protein